jgi:SWI/SNF-related matrix-associated actin-dependent regulator 1 of chromatin subfamily A
MGVHKRALSLVAEGLARFGVVMIDGSVPEAKRVEAVQAFQNDPATRVFVGNVRAAGTGLTLTAAADIVMLESSWSPADNAQALMRVHRVGQEKQVRARFISLANSIDDVVTDVVARKTAAIAKIQPPPEGQN